MINTTLYIQPFFPSQKFVKYNNAFATLHYWTLCCLIVMVTDGLFHLVRKIQQLLVILFTGSLKDLLRMIALCFFCSRFSDTSNSTKKERR